VIKIDKTDALYRYLKAIGVENIDETYIELAKNGRLKRCDVQSYFRDKFQPSLTNDLDEKDLELVVDYYADLKKCKKISIKERNELLKQYQLTKDMTIREKIINAELKDLLLNCLNYKSLHKDVDLQDLVQIANIGLIDAVEHYDSSAKIDFKDYIVYWVGKRIKDELEEKKND